MPSFLIGARFAQTVNNLIFRIVDLFLRSSYEHRVKKNGRCAPPILFKSHLRNESVFDELQGDLVILIPGLYNIYTFLKPADIQYGPGLSGWDHLPKQGSA